MASTRLGTTSSFFTKGHRNVDTSSRTEKQPTPISSTPTESPISSEKATSPTTKKAAPEDIVLLNQLGTISRHAAIAIGGSGVVAVAKQFGLDELTFEAAMLSEQFESFARAIARAVVKLEEGVK